MQATLRDKIGNLSKSCALGNDIALNLWHSPSQNGKVRWGAKHSPPANMSSGSATIAEQMILQLGMQRQPQTNKALLQRSFKLQPLLATLEQDAAHTATHH